MHPFRFAQLRGPIVTFAPEDDGYAEDWDGGPEEDPQDDESEEQDDEPEDEPEDYDQPDDQQTPQAEPQRQQRKSFAQRVEEVAERKAAEREQKLRQDFDQRLNQLTRPAQPTESPEQLRERILNMDQAEFAQFVLNQQAHMNQQFQFQAQDAADRSAYEALAARTPIADRYKAEVEQRLAEMRRNGTTAPRETVLRWVIGDKALENASRATNKARKTADANRQRQTARPTAGRSDQGHTQTDTSSSARDKRLENMSI